MGISGTIRLKHLSAWGGIDVIDGREVSGRMDRHLHDRDCLGIVESGTRIIHMDGQSMAKETGNVWYIPSRAVHAIELLNGVHSYKALSFDLPYLQRYFGFEPTIHGSIDGLKNESACYRAVQSFCKLTDEDLPLESESNLLTILQCFELGNNIECSPAVDGDEKVKKVRQYLDQYFAEPIFIDSLAKLAGWSPFHLERNFRQAAGMPLHQYQKMARIREAKRLLRDGRNLSYVASEAGFADQSHFSRTFKEMVGITPGAYLRAYQHR